ncbi:phage portal protein [Metaclostridioides mangenotii]|uniref:SPP1 family phage portal protein n=1 Tax=Metaclostridioides mangenotii TaxID=1540 RepID=A0ABS4E9N6_9FIRM|nr:phage portal protein [Clostridioides mangenotii]MBP1854662.1 SPP1 family phage portal protein [Clostridioides mangenotii]
MFRFIRKGVAKLNSVLNKPQEQSPNNIRYLEYEINQWKRSNTRKMQVIGEEYYDDKHDILKRKRTVIGEDGQLEEVDNLPNNKVMDNQYSKLVDQKVNYLFGKPFTYETDSEKYTEALKKVFNKKFLRMFKNLAEDSLNGGLGWLHPYYNDIGELSFKRFEAREILPFWKDSEHTELDFAIRLYETDIFEGSGKQTVEKVEVYSTSGIDRYILRNYCLIPDYENPHSSHLTIVENEKLQEVNWERVPLVAFKYNNNETPLIKRVKSLQDGINIMLSDFENNMQEDARNTILVLINYMGQNLGEFRKNLATYGAVKVKSSDGGNGDVKTLEVKVNAENYKAILDLFKKAIIENGRGYDAKSDRMQNNPNQMNIQSMYSDIDLDANGMETEFQASFEDLLWFINAHLVNTGEDNFFNEEVNIIFNRDILINETESIENCQKSDGIISRKTIITEHPWVKDVQTELDRIEDEEKDNLEDEMNRIPKDIDDLNKQLGSGQHGE